MYTFEAVFPMVCAWLVVAGAVAFIVYCSRAFDAEADRVAKYKP